MIFDEGLADEAALARQTTGAGRAARGRRAAPARGDRGAHRRPGRRRARARPRPRRRRRAPRSTAAPARASAASARSSRSCSTRSTPSPATSTAPAARCSGDPRSRSTTSPSRPASTPTAADALAHRRLPRRARRHAGVADAAQEIDDAGRAARSARFFVSRRQPGALGARRRRARARRSSRLDLMVSLDLYVNETNRHADYVLPATTWLEREDFPLAFLGFYTTPFVQYTDPVVAPRRRGARGVGDHRRASRGASASRPTRSKRLRRLGELGLRAHAAAAARPAAAHRPRPTCSGCAAAASSKLRAPARHRRSPSTSPPACCASRSATATGACASTRRRSCAELRRLDAAGNGDDPELPAAADRPARAALAQLVDAQRPAAHARRAHARRCASTPTTPRRSASRDGDAARVASTVRRGRGAGAGHRRDDARARSRCRTAGAIAAAGGWPTRPAA